MTRRFSIAAAIAASLPLAAAASCGSSRSGDTSSFDASADTSASGDASSDGGAGSDVLQSGDVIGFGDTIAAKEASSGPVSSLTLEQVWFITGEPTGTSKNFFVDFRVPGTPVVTCGATVPAATGDEGTAVFT